MPTQVGIHAFDARNGSKAWMPIFIGMTGAWGLACATPHPSAYPPPMPQTQVGTSEDLLRELSAWVRMETPSTDPTAVNRLMDVAEGELARAGARIERIDGSGGFGDTLIARTPGGGSANPGGRASGHRVVAWDAGIHALPHRWRQSPWPRHL